MILVDTSVRIDQPRGPIPSSPPRGKLATSWPIHRPPGELAIGTIRKGSEFIAIMGKLPTPPVTHAREVLNVIQTRALHSKELGILGAQLIATALQAPGIRRRGRGIAA
jgi:hypothetical protein